MSRIAPAIVLGRDGLRGRIVDEEAGHPGGTPTDSVLVRLDDGHLLSVPAAMLGEQADGSYSIALSLHELDLLRDASGTPAPDEVMVIPVVEETAQVSKRATRTGTVRVRKRVQERDEVVDVPLMREHLEVDRVAVNRVVEQAPATRQEGDVTIIPVVEEVLVVEKRLVLKEEVRITRKRVQERSPQALKLRTEIVEVERDSDRSRPD